jgi:tetratricopeptide (TPR) repeat protein
VKEDPRQKGRGESDAAEGIAEAEPRRAPPMRVHAKCGLGQVHRVRFLGVPCPLCYFMAHPRATLIGFAAIWELPYKAALLDLQVDNFNEAEEHLRKAIGLRPNFGPAHLNLGVVFLHRGNTEEGCQELLEALRLDPQLARAYYNLALLDVSNGRFEEAEELFKKVISLDRTYQAVYVRLGNL